MSDLRELLDREARRVWAEPDALEGVQRRAERRHRNRRLTAGGTALVVIALVSLGAWQLLGDAPAVERPGQSPTAPVTPSPSSGAGVAPDPETAARNFAMREYGWPEVFFDESQDGDHGNLENVRLYVSSCPTVGAIEGCEGVSLPNGGDEEALLEIGRIGPGWIVVRHWGPLNMAFAPHTVFGRLLTGGVTACPEGPFADLPDAQLLDAAEAYLTAANSPVPDADALWNGLTPQVQDQFRHYELFAHQIQKAQVDQHGIWELEGVSSDWPADMEETERCGQEVRDATSAVIVSFPASSNSQAIALLFVETITGPRYWTVRQP